MPFASDKKLAISAKSKHAMQHDLLIGATHALTATHLYSSVPLLLWPTGLLAQNGICPWSSLLTCVLWHCTTLLSMQMTALA